MKSKYSTLLIDGDDTLLDFKKAMELSLIDLFTHLDIELSKENVDLYESINDSYWKRLERNEVTRSEVTVGRFLDTFRELGIDADAKEANDYYMHKLSTHGLLLDGAFSFLCKCEKEFSLYMITNGTAFVQNRRIDDTNIRRFFKDIFISEYVGFEKPSVEYFQYVLSNIDEKDSSKILVIGDSLTSDIYGANRMGLDSVWFNPFGKENKTLSCPNETVYNFEQLLTYLEV